MATGLGHPRRVDRQDPHRAARARLLEAAGALTDDGQPEITLPDGALLRGPGPATDAALSDWLGHAVALVAAAGAPGAPAEFFADATDDTSQAIEWTMPAGRFVDALPLLVLTTASLRAGPSTTPTVSGTCGGSGRTC